MNVARIQVFLILFAILFNATSAKEASDYSEDNISKTILKAAVIAQVSRVGEWHGEGLGAHTSDWIIERSFAPESKSWIRRALGWGVTGNISEKWAPVGRTLGKHVGSVTASIVAIALIDRYYSPCKRFVSSFLGGDFKLTRAKKDDLRKVIEFSILTPCVGYLIYLDLKKNNN